MRRHIVAPATDGAVPWTFRLWAACTAMKTARGLAGALVFEGVLLLLYATTDSSFVFGLAIGLFAFLLPVAFSLARQYEPKR